MNNPELKPVDTTTGNPTELDPFDPANLRMSQDFTDTQVKKPITTVPVRRPGRHDFFRVRPGPEYWMQVPMLQIGDDKDFYLIRPDMVPHLDGEYAMHTIYTCINRQGTV